MSDDYAKGFKDGFAAGLEEGKKLIEEQWRLDKIKELEKTLPKPVTRLDDYLFGTAGHCSVCGKNWGNGGVWGYVCNNQYCPSRATAYSGGAVTGAVGAVTTGYIQTVGANGPTMNDSYELGN